MSLRATPPRSGDIASANPGTVFNNAKPEAAPMKPASFPTSTAARVATTATPLTSLSLPVHHPGATPFHDVVVQGENDHRAREGWVHKPSETFPDLREGKRRSRHGVRIAEVSA